MSRYVVYSSATYAGRRLILLVSISVAVVSGSLARAQNTSPIGDVTQPIVPKEGVIRLLNGKDLEGLYTFLEDVKYEDPRQVFSVRDGILVISGEGYGGINTKNAYKDYHLVCEFKWGQRTWGDRKTRARDSGILVHGIGPDNSFLGRWMTCYEAQIIEGGLGDILVVSGKGKDGKQIPVSLTAEITTDRDGEYVWQKGGTRRRFHKGRINWYGRDPDWNGLLDFRGANDIGDPHDKWMRMDVICDGDYIGIMVNGVLVNEACGASHGAGRITIQSEQAEIFIRRWELWPLGQAPAYKTNGS